MCQNCRESSRQVWACQGYGSCATIQTQSGQLDKMFLRHKGPRRRDIPDTNPGISQADHWEIKGRFRKKGGFGERTLVPVFVPGEHPPKPPFWKPPFCQPPKRVIGRLKGRFPKGWFWRTFPRSGFRSGGTPAENTLLETTLLRTAEQRLCARCLFLLFCGMAGMSHDGFGMFQDLDAHVGLFESLSDVVQESLGQFPSTKLQRIAKGRSYFVGCHNV